MPLVMLLGSLLILTGLGLALRPPSSFSPTPKVVLSQPTATTSPTWREPSGTVFTLPARMRMFDPCQRTAGPWTDRTHPGYQVGTEFEPRNEPIACDDPRPR